MLNVLLSALGALGDQNQRQSAQAAADQEAGKELHKAAKSAADAGDWEWLTDNQDSLQRHLHPDILKSIVSTATRQNARLYDAETAEGGRATIPLSPRNVYERGQFGVEQGTVPTYDQRTPKPLPGMPGQPDPMQAAIQATSEGGQGPSFSGLQGIPNNETFNSSYGPSGAPPSPQFLDQNNAVDQPRGADAPSLGGEIDQLAQLNSQLRGALDAAPGGQPPQAAPPQVTGSPELQVPANRQPINQTRTIPTAIGNRTITKNLPGTTGKEVLASLISQGEQQGMHPQAILKTFNEENIRRLKAGEPALDLDEGAINAYRTRSWETLRAGIQRNLAQQGMDPTMAFEQSAKMAFNQAGYVPEQWMQVVKPDGSQVVGGAYQTVINQANEMLGQRLQAMSEQQGKEATFRVNEPFLLQAVNSVPGLPPAERSRVLHELANTSHNAFLSAVQQSHPNLDPTQQNYYAMSLASKAVGGNVPEQWRNFVEQDMQKLFALSDADMVAYNRLSPFARPDPLDPDFRNRLQSVRTQLEMDKEFRGAYLRTAGDVESVAQVQQMLAPQSTMPGAQPGGPPKAAQPGSAPTAGGPRGAASGGAAPAPTGGGTPTPSSIGQGQRGRELAQAGRKEQQSKDIERKNAILPTTERDKLRSQDQLYQRAITSMHLAKKKGPDGQSLVDKYGSTPGTFFDWAARAQAELGRQDPQLAKYLQSISSFYNMQRHELSGAAVSPYEGKTLKPDLPGPGDNIRTGLMKLNNIAKQLGTFMAQDIKQLRKDYPASDYDSYFYSRLESKRAERKQSRTKKKED